MPKPMYVWSGTAWVSVASEVESLAGFATQSYADNTPGTKLIVPSSVAVGSGSGSVATQGTVSFSGASSVVLNNCFSSTYNRYRILLSATGSTNQLVYMRLRTGSTDSTTAYGVQSLCADSTTIFGSRTTPGYFEISNAARAAGRFIAEIELFNPQAASVTYGLNRCSSIVLTDTTQITHSNYSLIHDVSTSYESVNFYTSTGTMTGSVSVYGYKAG